jgi:hypothetical protein
MVDLSPTEAAAVLACCKANLAGLIIPAERIPHDIGPAMVKLTRAAKDAPQSEPRDLVDEMYRAVAKSDSPSAINQRKYQRRKAAAGE